MKGPARLVIAKPSAGTRNRRISAKLVASPNGADSAWFGPAAMASPPS